MENNNVMMNENNTTATTKEKKDKGVLSISSAFVDEFTDTCSAEDLNWIVERVRYWKKEKGERGYFAPFRSEFVNKFFPEMKAKKKPVKKAGLLEKLEAKQAMRNA